MKKIFFLAVTAASAMLALSCSKVIEFKGEQVEEKLVLFAEAKAGEPFTANLSHSVFFLDAYNGYDKYIRHINTKECKVEVSINGGKPVVMTYEPDTTMEPFFFGVYSLKFVCNCIPSPGDQIEVTAIAPGYDPVKATVSVPRHPEAKVSAHTVDTLAYDIPAFKHTVTLDLKDPGLYSKYYRLNVLSIYKDPSTGEEAISGIFPVHSADPVFISTSQDIEGIIGNIENIDQSDSDREVPDFFSDQLFFGGSYSLTFNFTKMEYYYEPTLEYEVRKALRRASDDIPYGESLVVLLRAVTPGTYYYLRSINSSNSDFELFAEGSTIYSNVEGGYGAVCAGADAIFVLDN